MEHSQITSARCTFFVPHFRFSAFRLSAVHVSGSPERPRAAPGGPGRLREAKPLVWHRMAAMGIELHPLASIGIQWHRLASIGIERHQLASVDIHWHPLASMGIDWYLLASTGIEWHPLASIDIHGHRLDIGWHQVVSIRIELHPLAFIGTDWHPLISTGDHWYRFAHIGIDCHRLPSVGSPGRLREAEPWFSNENLNLNTAGARQRGVRRSHTLGTSISPLSHNSRAPKGIFANYLSAVHFFPSQL